MVVEECLAEDFPLKIDQSTNMTKFTSCASRWDTLIQVQVQVYISKKSLMWPTAGLESGSLWEVTQSPGKSPNGLCNKLWFRDPSWCVSATVVAIQLPDWVSLPSGTLIYYSKFHNDRQFCTALVCVLCLAWSVFCSHTSLLTTWTKPQALALLWPLHTTICLDGPILPSNKKSSQKFTWSMFVP